MPSTGKVFTNFQESIVIVFDLYACGGVCMAVQVPKKARGIRSAADGVLSCQCGP